jgi:tripartite-type tricarboxylate transporter receptor subunit TctC
MMNCANATSLTEIKLARRAARDVLRDGEALRRNVRAGTARSAALLGALAALLATPALAQDPVADFYKGKQVSIIIGSSAGGGYDTYARLIGRHLGKHIPGNPVVVPSNMPGAASNIAAAYVYNVAPKDGTVIGAVQTAAVLDPLFADKARLKHDSSKFIYLGSATVDYYVCVIRADADVKDFKDAQSHEVIMGASAPGTSTRDFPALLNNAAGAKFRIVSGYPGTREITLAIEKGEVQGVCGFSWSSLSAQHPDWLAKGFIRVLVQENEKGHPEVNKLGVPHATDFARTPQDRQIMDLIYSSEIFGRPYVLPPGLPAERVAVLRKAFLATLHDPDLQAEGQKLGLDLDPISGEELQTIAAKMYATPPEVVERAKQAVVYRAP